MTFDERVVLHRVDRVVEPTALTTAGRRGPRPVSFCRGPFPRPVSFCPPSSHLALKLSTLSRYIMRKEGLYVERMAEPTAGVGDDSRAARWATRVSFPPI